MAYSRPVLPGVGLKQRPIATVPPQNGVQQTTLDVEIATTSSLGVVQVGNGLSITAAGVLSTVTSVYINVTLTNSDYTALAKDYYIGATKKDIIITLPLGVSGKVYIVKNQVVGSIKVKPSGGQKIDTAVDKTLGTDVSITLVFDGARWNIIN